VGFGHLGGCAGRSGRNARNLGAPVAFVACDLVSAFASASMDLIVSNPPYVPLREAAGCSGKSVIGSRSKPFSADPQALKSING